MFSVLTVLKDISDWLPIIKIYTSITFKKWNEILRFFSRCFQVFESSANEDKHQKYLATYIKEIFLFVFYFFVFTCSQWSISFYK